LATLASLSIDLVANSATLVKEVKKANKSLGTIEKTARQVSGVVKLAIGTIAVGAFKNMAMASIDAADQAGKLAMRLGTTSEAISELAYVANLSGVNVNAMNMGLQRMTRRVAEAAGGTGEATKALKELNISAVALNKLAPEKQFEVLSEAISNLKNDSDKVRLSMKLFDSEGVALIQTMGDGARGIRAMREEARKMGASISTEASNSAAAFNDEMLRLNTRMDGITRVAAIGFARAFVDIGDAILGADEKIEDFNDSTDDIERVLKAITVIGVGSAATVATLGEALAGVGIVLSELGKGNFSNISSELDIVDERIKDIDDRFSKFLEKLYSDKETPTPIESAVEVVPPNEAGPVESVALDPSLGLGGGPSLEEKEKEEERLKKMEENLEKFTLMIHEQNRVVEEGLLYEEQLRDDHYTRQLNTIDAFHANQMASIIKHEGNVLKQNKKMEALQNQTDKKKLMLGKKYGMELLSQAAETSRAAFNIQKVAAIADGIIKAKESILGAYAFGNKIGGPPVGAAFAALAGVNAAAQLNAIKSAQFGGGDSGGSSISGGTPAVNTPTAETTAINDFEEPQTKTIYFNVEGIGDAELLPKSAVRGLIDLINDERESNVRVVI
jgi:hypothetical protein